MPAGLLDRVDETSWRLHETVHRREADQRLREALAQRNFTGALYETFETELVRYAHSVLRGWMHTGYLFHLLADRGLRLNPSEQELTALSSDGDLREELATMTVAVALPRFKQDALIDGGWTPEGGASLATYFTGACLYVFANEFRRWRSQRRRWARQDQTETLTRDPDVDEAGDPAVVAIGNLHVAEHLNLLGGREAAIVTMKMNGYTLQEIAETLGEASVRAVEGVLYRWRSRAKDLIEEGGEQI